MQLNSLPSQTLGDVQIFNCPSTVTNLQWGTLQRPCGVSMAHIICIGGGGGGGGGFTGVSLGAGGGGSGGSSGVTRVTLPAVFLPKVLYIQVGAGGSGGGPTVTGGSGILSYVAIAPDTTAINVIAVSGAAGAVGGAPGDANSGGAGGAAGTIAVIGSMPLAGPGHFALIAGQVGVIGGDDSGASGTAIAFPTTSVVTQAGSGGAGAQTANFAGGAFTAIADLYFSEARPATPATGSFNGSGGPQLWKPFFSFGGGGGSSSFTAAGGHGGHGAYGGGGGGGGGGETLGGTGGNGGSGLVMIVWT